MLEHLRIERVYVVDDYENVLAVCRSAEQAAKLVAENDGVHPPWPSISPGAPEDSALVPAESGVQHRSKRFHAELAVTSGAAGPDGKQGYWLVGGCRHVLTEDDAQVMARAELRARALAKLSPEEIVALGFVECKIPGESRASRLSYLKRNEEQR